MEFSLLAAAAVGVFGFWLMLRWEGPRGNAAGCAVDLWDAGLVSVVVGLLAGRLVAMAAAGINPLTDPGQILLIRSGVSTGATALATVAVFGAVTRSQFFPAADGISAAALAGLAGWHAGCLPTSGCLGTASNLPWAYPLAPGGASRHPVGLYAAVLLLIGAIVVALWKQHGRPPLAAPAGAALAIAGGVNLVAEPMRISLDGGPEYLYASGVILGVIVIAGAFLRRSRSRNADPMRQG
jgi:hypothetical protein